MTRGRLRTLAGAGLAVGLAAASYPILWRNRCLTWGATADEVAANLPGDELLPDARVVTTRAIQIGAPPDCVWPWLMQMGSGRAGDYTYDWMENLLGLDSHSAEVILPQFQQVNPGDEFGYPAGRRTIRVEILRPPRVYVRRLTDGSWVSIYTLSGENGTTRLVNRNRYAPPSRPTPSRMAWSMLIEPGGLLLQRKMLLGIKERAERLAGELTPSEPHDADSLLF
jgi:hypothetical protein